MPERDPLTELRAAWTALDAPAVADDWRDTDPRTRVAVDWMRAAWSEVRPSRPLTPPVRTWRTFHPWRAAAAALLVGTALASAIDRGRVAGTPAAESIASSTETITVAAVEPDRLELISGPVRLILLSPETKEKTR